MAHQPTWRIRIIPPGKPYNHPTSRAQSLIRDDHLILIIRMIPKIVVPQNGWFIMENLIKMDALGGKPTIFGNIQVIPGSQNWMILMGSTFPPSYPRGGATRLRCAIRQRMRRGAGRALKGGDDHGARWVMGGGVYILYIIYTHILGCPWKLVSWFISPI